MKSGRKRKPVNLGLQKSRPAAKPSQSGDGRAHRSWLRERREWLLLAGILIATLLAFINALNGEFLYDDQVQILRNPTIKTLANIPRVFVQSVWQFLNEASDQPLGLYYRPVFNATLIVNYQLFGLKVVGWHVTSVLLHITATLLVYFLARRWNLTPAAAAAAALFFGLHPIHSESVAWISALPDVLAGVFALSCLLLYELRYDGRGDRRNLVTLSLGFALLAMLSKEVAVVIPLFLIVREWLDRTEQETYTATLSRMLRRTAPFVLISFLYFGLRYWVLGFISKPAPSAAGFTASQVFLTIPSILLRYARLFFFPTSLAIVYDDKYISNATDVRFWGAALILVAIVGGAFWLVRFSPPGRRAFVWSILLLVPVLNLKAFNEEESLVHDRYLYLPSIGLCLLAALALTWVSSRFGKHQRQVFYIGTVLIGVILLALTVYQNRSWQNFIALANHGSMVAPEKPFLYYNLGCAYEAQGQDPEAEQKYRQAIQYKSSHTEARINLAVLLTKQSRYDEALEHLRVCQSLAPDNPVMLYALGNLYMRTNRHKEAIEVLDQLTRIKPQHRMAYTNLGLCYEAIGDVQQAKVSFKKAIEVAPAEEWTNVARKHLAKLEN